MPTKSIGPLMSNTCQSQHKGWYFSGSAPHHDAPEAYQFITFRLADSLPQHLLRNLRQLAMAVPETEQDRFQRRETERWLDAGMGCCALAHHEMAAAVKDTLLFNHGVRYELIAWCIMPNHVHVLIRQKHSLPRIIQTWKSFTTRWMLSNNERLGLGVPANNLWMRDYWDRVIRNEQHLLTVIHYIHHNPVKAGLCEAAEEWPWSSASDNQN